MNTIANHEPDTLALVDYHQAKTILKTPSVLLSPELRPALFECWACHRHLTGMETSLPIAAMFSIWINRWGLSNEDAREILQQAQHPEHLAAHKFASDLTTALAAAVSVRLKKRAAEAELAERRRASQTTAPISQADREALRTALSGIGGVA